MKKQLWIFFVALITIISVQFNHAEQASAKTVRESQFGIGIGSSAYVSGVSGKLMLGESAALQANLGSVAGYRSGWWSSDFGVSADFLLEMPPLLEAGVVDIAWSLGAGGSILLVSDVILAASGVLGIEFNVHVIPEFPVDFVVEWRPSAVIYNGITINADTIFEFGGHLRVYF